MQLPNGAVGQMPYVVQEVALGGEIFDFVSTGPFPEKVARAYFR